MFDAEKEIQGIVSQIRGYFEAAKVSRAVIGISGGKDSAIAAALAAKALGYDNVVGVMMPNGEQPDIDDSRKLCAFLKIKSRTINIKGAFDELCTAVGGLSVNAFVNLAPRLRMATLYTVAASENALVVGTGNYSEIYVGYTTKFGDSASDFNPLGEYLSDEVVKIGDALGLPHDIVHKPPSDGLTGKTDEQSFGFGYAELNEYIRTGKCADSKVKQKIDTMHRASRHKFAPVPTAARAKSI